MEALANYGSDESDEEKLPAMCEVNNNYDRSSNKRALPAPCFSTLRPSRATFKIPRVVSGNGNRSLAKPTPETGKHGLNNSCNTKPWVRSFAHVDGNWPSHVYVVGEMGTNNWHTWLHRIQPTVPLDARIPFVVDGTCSETRRKCTFKRR
jgi:hypothetical protein